MKHAGFYFIVTFAAVLISWNAAAYAESLPGRFLLMNSPRSQVIWPLHNGDTIDLETLPGNLHILFRPADDALRTITYDPYELRSAVSNVSSNAVTGRYKHWIPHPGKFRLIARSNEYPPRYATLDVAFRRNSQNQDNRKDEIAASRGMLKSSTETKTEPEFVSESPEIEAEKINAFISKQQQLAEGEDLDATLELYAQRVRYYNSGLVQKEVIRKDKENYVRRWPLRLYVYDDVHISNTESPSKKKVRFYSDFSVSNDEQTMSGRSKNFFILDLAPEEPKIISERSEVVRREPVRKKSALVKKQVKIVTQPLSIDPQLCLMQQTFEETYLLAKMESACLLPEDSSCQISHSDDTSVVRSTRTLKNLKKQKRELVEDTGPKRIVFALTPTTGVDSQAGGQCVAIYQETSRDIQIVCTYTLEEVSAAYLVRSPDVGASLANRIVCDLGAPQSPIVQSCLLTAKDKEAFNTGQLGVAIATESLPNGALMGNVRTIVAE